MPDPVVVSLTTNPFHTQLATLVRPDPDKPYYDRLEFFEGPVHNGETGLLDEPAKHQSIVASVNLTKLAELLRPYLPENLTNA